tara:strand:+ start:125 stop:592 length:468 start_codon:yes stop_codon:yes gene_type:complete
MSKDYEENVDTLITFGEEGHTMRKDDPRTKEAVEKSQGLLEERRKELILSGEASVFAGINLNNKREEDETSEEYKDRRTTNNNLRKIYQKLGREKCIEMYPQGFAYAIQQALIEENRKQEGIKDKDGNPLKMVATDSDGKVLDMDIQINNDDESN